MKERLILFCMLLLCGIGVSRAQSGNAKDFDQKEETIVQKLQQAVNEKNYKEAEKNGKALITLFKEQDENTQKKYSWLIQYQKFRTGLRQWISRLQPHDE
mgnify:CR=1 FL=1